MISAHIFGIPVEENLPYVIPAIVTFFAGYRLRLSRCNCCRKRIKCQCKGEV